MMSTSEWVQWKQWKLDYHFHQLQAVADTGATLSIIMDH
jgi:hypothetical protein